MWIQSADSRGILAWLGRVAVCHLTGRKTLHQQQTMRLTNTVLFWASKPKRSPLSRTKRCRPAQTDVDSLLLEKSVGLRSFCNKVVETAETDTPYMTPGVKGEWPASQTSGWGFTLMLFSIREQQFCIQSLMWLRLKPVRDTGDTQEKEQY